MKKSYTLLITIVLLSLFSYLALSIAQTKSFSNKNIENQYLYIQGKNHLNFTKEYINSLDISELENIDKLTIENKNFDIKAVNKKEEDKFKIEIFIQSKSYDIRLYEKMIR